MKRINRTRALIMIAHFFRFASCCLLFVSVCEVAATAQTTAGLTEWKAKQEVVARLGEPFSDDRIQITPPGNLVNAEQPNPPELVKIGVYRYVWILSDEVPSLENMSVTLTPFAMPSAKALDQTIEGMQTSIQKNLEEVKFGKVRSGRLGQMEVRAGQYTALISDEKVTAYYLVGIDKTGTFAVTAMLPDSKATPKKIEELKSSILTFQRAK